MAEDLNTIAVNLGNRGNAIDFEISEIDEQCDGDLTGNRGIVRPNAIFVNGERILAPKHQEIEIHGLNGDELLEVRLTMYVREFRMTRRSSDG